MRIGVPKETYPGERRVALVPSLVQALKKSGLDVAVESGAGDSAGFPDRDFAGKGAAIVPSRAEVFSSADIVAQVRTAGANPARGEADLPLMRKGLVVVGMAEPLTATDAMKAMAAQGATTFALELLPRITRAQSMDVLSSMATIAGYKAVLLAATSAPRMFPMLMTAAGTVAPARVLVIGAGVAGLQAIATSRRLGARVEAYDVRPAVKEQVQSLGAKFVELALDTSDAQDQGGYAKALDESFYKRQRELLGDVIAAMDVVITTAAVPGKRAPILVTAEMVRRMAPGSVIVDLAAERGGNCELTRPDEVVDADGVTIVGPSNLPGTVPFHASQMYGRNMTTFLQHLVKKGELVIDPSDEITRDTLITKDGEVVNARVREAAGLAPLPQPAPAA